MPYCRLAYMLHPKYAGQGMDLQHAEQGRAWFAEHNPEFLAAAISFQAEALSYPESFFQPAPHTMEPVTWWKAVRFGSDLPDGFVDLIISLHMASASSESLERIFRALLWAGHHQAV